MRFTGRQRKRILRLPIDEFIANLKRHGVCLVIDVRSYARSRWTQYNGPALELEEEQLPSER